MNQQDNEAISQLAAATEPGVKITRQGYAALEGALAYLVQRLNQLESISVELQELKNANPHRPSTEPNGNAAKKPGTS